MACPTTAYQPSIIGVRADCGDHALGARDRWLAGNAYRIAYEVWLARWARQTGRLQRASVFSQCLLSPRILVSAVDRSFMYPEEISLGKGHMDGVGMVHPSSVSHHIIFISLDIYVTTWRP